MLGSLRGGFARAYERSRREAAREAIPPGWRYNPSAWRERFPILALAFAGFVISIYLTLNQVGAIPPVWDPIFGSASSEAVLHSVVSRYTIVPDSSLGILGYLADMILDSLGGPARWRTAPCVVLAFGLTIGALGGVSSILVIVQGVVVRDWCTFCLCSALASTLVLALGFGETLAALQHLRRQVGLGAEFWPSFWGPALWDVICTLR